MKAFTYKDIRNEENGGNPFGFAEDLTRIFRCRNNYEVEDILKSERVVFPSNLSDPEHCTYVVYFKTLLSGKKFIDRLNAFIARSEKG